mgnify:CR=1 FL=1
MKAFFALVDPRNLPQVDASEGKLQDILNIVFVVIGALAFLMLVVAGLRYVLAQGDPTKVAEARRQIIYSFVGLIVAVLAVAIVNLVLGRL